MRHLPFNMNSDSLDLRYGYFLTRQNVCMCTVRYLKKKKKQNKQVQVSSEKKYISISGNCLRNTAPPESDCPHSCWGREEKGMVPALDHERPPGHGEVARSLCREVLCGG